MFEMLNSILKTTTLLLLLIGWSGLSIAAPCNYYQHRPMSLRTADSHYKLSVIHIVSGKKEGTAFLIDGKRGLFLTARHVVEASIPENGEPPKTVVGRFEELNAEPLELSVIAEDVGLDVALLEVASLNRLTDRIPLELSFAFPSSQEVGFLGATFSASDVARIRLREADGFAVDIETNRLEIPTAVRGGDSGAPVLKDDDGLVIAIVLKNKTTDLVVALPLSLVADFLASHASADVPSEIWDRFSRSTTPDPEVVSETLQTQPKSVASNFHILGLTHALWARNPRLDLPHDLAGCSIYDAASGRELGQYAGKLYAMSLGLKESSSTGSSTGDVAFARAIFAAAESEEPQDNPERTGALYLVAAELFKEASTERLAGDNSGAYLKTWFDDDEGIEVTSDAATMAFMEAAYAPFDIDMLVVPSERPQKSDTLAAILLDYQTSLRRAAGLIKGVNTTAIESDALVAAAWGAQVSRSPRLAAANYQALGDMLTQRENYEAASLAYANAWNNGSTTFRTLENFRFTETLRTGRIMPDTSTVVTINEAPKFEGMTLRAVVSSLPRDEI